MILAINIVVTIINVIVIASAFYLYRQNNDPNPPSGYVSPSARGFGMPPMGSEMDGMKVVGEWLV